MDMHNIFKYGGDCLHNKNSYHFTYILSIIGNLSSILHFYSGVTLRFKNCMPIIKIFFFKRVTKCQVDEATLALTLNVLGDFY